MGARDPARDRGLLQKALQVTERTVLERVRVRGDAEASTARLRLGNLLAGAELRPAGLPPSALLCVRRVVDPLPGALPLDTHDARPPPEWERAFVATLEDALRAAARPAREAVPAGAEAVLFADRAELLACLARDAADGIAWMRWWWRGMRAAAAPGDDPVAAAFLAEPEHVPAALDLLAERGEAARVVSALPEHVAVELAVRVAAVHGAEELRAALAGLPPRGSPPSERGGSRSPPPRPPWRHVLSRPESVALAPAQEVVLGISLALRRTPARARTQAFAAAVRAWRAAAPAAAPDAHDAASAPPPAKPPPVAAESAARPAAIDTRRAPQIPQAPAPEEPLEPRREPPVLLDASVPIATEAPVEPEPRAAGRAAGPARRPAVVETPRAEPERPPATTEKAAEEALSDEPSAPPPAAEVRRSRPAPRTPTRQRRRRPPAALRRPETPAPLRPAPAEEDPLLPARPVETGLGGLFYLLNLGIFLGLYADFTRPLEPGIALDPWDYLTLLGRRLLGSRAREDPVWRLLARLAGRPSRQPPGRGFRPPRAWRVAPDWLEPFEDDGVWRWSAARQTLRLTHPAGFTAVAVPRTAASPERQLRRELARLRRRPELRRTSLPPEPARPLARWVARLAGYADARLHRALDLPGDRPLAPLLFERPARVFVSPTHVDVVLQLAELPLEVRFAGLDRTPGWVPAAGRYVAFHFE
jgi:hypothetical protein